MPNIRLVIEYDGSRFCGWQKQPGQRTIEEAMHRALEMALRKNIHCVTASGRTDTGVHAKGQVVNFRVDEVPDLHRLGHAVSSILKNEVSVISADIVPDDFHATRSAVCKQYRYTIFNRPTPPVQEYGRVWHIGTPLNIECMKQESLSFIGVHDFTSFRSGTCESTDPVKEIFESEVTYAPPFVVYRVVGSGFLKQMVRTMVGTLVQLAEDRLDLSSVRQILAAKDRRVAGMTAPAHGLCLDWVKYDV